jgi:hypothetical protein
MTVDFTNTVFDLVRFNLYHASRRVVNWVMVIGTALFLSRSMSFEGLSVRIAAFFVFAVVLTVVLFVATGLIASVSYVPSKNRGVIGDHRLTLTDETLTEETSVSRQTWSWVGVPKVSRTSAYVFIYVQQNSAHIVPTRSFPNPAEVDRFFEFAVETWKRARAGA